MKKLILLILSIVIITTIINYCSDDDPAPEKKFTVTMADGTVCELFDVGQEMEFVSTSRQLKTEEYQEAAKLFRFPKSKMVYFHLDGKRGTGEHYGTLYMDAAVEVENKDYKEVKDLKD